MSSVVENVVRARPGAHGLAVIVANDDYSQSPPHLRLENLPGAARDGQALSQALGGLNFAVHLVKNISRHALMQLVHEMSRLRYHMVKDYCCILFVFAGHGCEGDYLYMPSGEKVQVAGEVVGPLVPASSQEIGNIPKVFLIDACRGSGDTDTVLVPRSSLAGGGARGGTLIDRIRVAAEGEYLLAYSTLPRRKAYEVPGKGGVWLSTLARLINERQHLQSFEGLLTKVNEEVKGRLQGEKSFQQPERYSRINGFICLDPRGVQCRPQIATGATSAIAPASRHVTTAPEGSRFRVLLHEYVQKNGGNLIDKYTEAQDHSKRTIFKCTLTYSVNGRSTTRDSGSYYPRKDEAKEMAAKSVYLVVSSGGSGGAGPVATSTRGAVQGVQSGATSSDVSWVSKLKEHYDKQGKPGMGQDFKVQETAVGGFIARIFVPELGREVEGAAAKSKKEAKQNAAKKALNSIKK